MRLELDMDSIVSRRADLVATDIDQDKVFLDIALGKYYGINRVGSSIWDIAEQPVSIADICRELMGRFEIDEATCKKETLAFCQSLVESGSFVLASEG